MYSGIATAINPCAAFGQKINAQRKFLALYEICWGCLKMIFDNHERQPSFLRLAVEKLSNNFKKQRTYPEGQDMPLKKCVVYTFGDAMQQSGQPGAFPTGLFVLYGAASEDYRPCSQDTILP